MASAYERLILGVPVKPEEEEKKQPEAIVPQGTQTIANTPVGVPPPATKTEEAATVQTPPAAPSSYDQNSLYNRLINAPARKGTGGSPDFDPSTLTPELQEKYTRMASEERADLERGEFMKGVYRGAHGLASSLYGGVALLGSKEALDIQALRDIGIAGYKKHEGKAEYYPGVRLTDIDSPGKAVQWAVGTLGELAPSMAEAMMTATIGAIAGTAAAPGAGTAAGAVGGFLGKTVLKKGIGEMVEKMVAGGIRKEIAESAATRLAYRALGTKAGIVGGVSPLEIGGNYMEALEKGVDSPLSAITTGLAAGFLELAGGNSRTIKKILGANGEKMLNDALAKADVHLVSRIFKEAATQAPQEFTQEAMQEALAMANMAYADPTFEAFTKENALRLLESGAAGAVGGAAGGAVGGVVPNRKPPMGTPSVEGGKVADEVKPPKVGGEVPPVTPPVTIPGVPVAETPPPLAEPPPESRPPAPLGVPANLPPSTGPTLGEGAETPPAAEVEQQPPYFGEGGQVDDSQRAFLDSQGLKWEEVLGWDIEDREDLENEYQDWLSEQGAEVSAGETGEVGGAAEVPVEPGAAGVVEPEVPVAEVEVPAAVEGGEPTLPELDTYGYNRLRRLAEINGLENVADKSDEEIKTELRGLGERFVPEPEKAAETAAPAPTPAEEKAPAEQPVEEVAAAAEPTEEKEEAPPAKEEPPVTPPAIPGVPTRPEATSEQPAKAYEEPTVAKEEPIGIPERPPATEEEKERLRKKVVTKEGEAQEVVDTKQVKGMAGQMMTKLEKELGEKTVGFIKGKIGEGKELDSLEKVNKHYSATDTSVDRYARLYAKEVFGAAKAEEAKVGAPPVGVPAPKKEVPSGKQAEAGKEAKAGKAEEGAGAATGVGKEGKAKVAEEPAAPIGVPKPKPAKKKAVTWKDVKAAEAEWISLRKIYGEGNQATIRALGRMQELEKAFEATRLAGAPTLTAEELNAIPPFTIKTSKRTDDHHAVMKDVLERGGTITMPTVTGMRDALLGPGWGVADLWAKTDKSKSAVRTIEITKDGKSVWTGKTPRAAAEEIVRQWQKVRGEKGPPTEQPKTAPADVPPVTGDVNTSIAEPPPKAMTAGWTPKAGDRVAVGESMRGTILRINGDQAHVHLDQYKNPKAYSSVPVSLLRPDPQLDAAYSALISYAKTQKKDVSDSTEFGEIQGKLDFDKRNILRLFGEKMYEQNTALATIKELLQNSFDAVKAVVAKQTGKKQKPGKIRIKIDSNERSIEFSDDGIGMTPEVVQTAFFTVAGSNKADLPPHMRSGGLGLAKLLFMLSSDRIELTTTRDGVRTTVSATQSEIINDAFKIRTAKGDKGAHGTTVKVYLPEYKVNPDTGENRYVYFPDTGLRYIEPLQQPLIGPVDVTIQFNDREPETIPIGVNFKPEDRGFTKLTTANTSWGKMDIYLGKERKEYPSHQILSSGVYQFQHRFSLNMNEYIPYDLIINVFPNVSAQSNDYPFTNTREKFAPRITQDVGALEAYLAQVARGIEAEGLQNVFDNIRSLPKTEVGEGLGEGVSTEEARAAQDRARRAFEEREKRESQGAPATSAPEIEISEEEVRDMLGRLLADSGKKRRQREEKEKEGSFAPEKAPPKMEDFMKDMDADPNNPIFHNNTNLDVVKVGQEAGGDPAMFFAELGSVLVEVRDALATSHLSGMAKLKASELFYTGISIDKKYAGIFLKVPFKSAMLNPLGSNYRPKTLFAVRELIMDTIIHEFAHAMTMEHGEYHNAAMEQVRGWLADEGLLDHYRDAILQTLLKHEKAYRAMKGAYDKSTTQNLAKSFKDQAAESAIAGRAEGVGRGEPATVPGREGPGRGENIPGDRGGAEKGQEPGRGGEAGRGGAPTARLVREMFPGAVVEKGDAEGEFTATLESGARITVKGGLIYNERDVEEQLGRPMTAQDKVRGMWTKIGKGGVVALIDGARDFTRHHEAFHAMMDLALTPAEQLAVLRAFYGDHERAANAYAKWRLSRNEQTVIGRLFAKIWDAAIRIRDAMFGPSAAGVMRTIESGRAASRTEAEVSGSGRPRFEITGVPSAVSRGFSGTLYRAAKAVSALGITTKRPAGSMVKGEIAHELQERSRTVLEGLGITPGDLENPRLRDLASSAIAMEIQAAMEKSGHAGDWYSNKIEGAMRVAALVHPELATDAKARLAYRLALSITSQNQGVPDNTNLAEKQYAAFMSTGKFPEIGAGTASTQMASNFRKANALFKEYKPEFIERFLNTKFTVKELETAGWKVHGELTTFEVHGSAIFGPKIGNGFYQNISGNFDPLTVDMWFMRGFGRLVGDLVPGDKKLVRTQMKRLADELHNSRGLVEPGDGRVFDMYKLKPRPDSGIEGPFTPESIKDPDVLLEFANRIDSWFSSERNKHKEDYNAGKLVKPQVVYAAQQLKGNAEPKDTPRGGAHRQQIREVFQQALEKLADQGIVLTTADAQAIWWYPEKELYGQLGYRMGRAEPTDYEQEMARLAKQKGVSDASIESARRTRGVGGRAGGRAGAGKRQGTGGPAVPAGRGTLNERERLRLLAERTIRTYRRGLGSDPSQPSGPYNRRSLGDGGKLRVLGAAPIAEYTLQTVAANRFKEGGMPTTQFYELSQSDAPVFHKAMSEATALNPHSAAVYIYPVDDYASMRLFLSKDGTSGMALKGQDLVSAFSTPGKAPTGIIHAMLQLGIQEGGRTLDCFDTVLPEFYSIHGIRIVARIPWDDSQAPDSWNKKTFAKFNNGEPDVVFGVYDPNYDDLYKAGDGQTFTDYDAAVSHQLAEAERLGSIPPALKPRFSVEADHRTMIDDYQRAKIAEMAAKPSLMDRLRQMVDYNHIKTTVFPALRAAWEKFYTETVAEHFHIEKLADTAMMKTVLGIPRKAGEILKGALAAHRGAQGMANQALIGDGVWLPVMQAGVESKVSLALKQEIEDLEAALEQAEEGSREANAIGRKLVRALDKLEVEMARTYASGDIERVHDSLQKVTEPLRELAKRRGVDPNVVFNDLFKAKMIAERDLELSGQIGDRAKLIDKGVDPEAANAVLDSLKAEYGADYQVLEDVGKDVRSWANMAVIEPLVRSGRMSSDLAAKIRRSNQFYIPFFRVIEEMEEKGFVGQGAGMFEVRKIPVMEIKGSERKIVDPLQMLVKLAFNAADVASKAHVARSIAEIPLFSDAGGDIRTVRARYFPVPVDLRQAVDPVLRKSLMDVAASMNVNVTVKQRIRGRSAVLGSYMRAIRQEAATGLISREELHWIETMFGSTERTLAHEIGHAIDAFFSDRVGRNGRPVGKLQEILMATPQMKRELREVADRRIGDAASRSFREYVRKREEQVAEFVATYLYDRHTAINYAPHAVEALETFLRAHEEVRALTNVRLSGQTDIMHMTGETWVRSPFRPEPNTMLYYRDGKANWLHMPPEIYRAAMGMNHGDVGLLMKIASAPARWLRSGAVLTPEFISRNPLRDIMMAWVFSRHGFSMRGWLQDFFKVIAGDEDARKVFAKFEGGGGAFSDLASMFIETQEITAEKIRGERRGIMYCAHPMDALREVSSFVESLTRYSVYRQAMANGASHAAAIHEARTITLDFHRMGGNPYVRVLNMIIPFFNASVQGIDKLGSELFSGDRKRSMRVMSRIAIGITLPSILLWAMFGDDDRVKELESWERNLFWHIPIPGGPLLRIPKPFEVGIAFGSLPERMLDWYATGDTSGLKQALTQAGDAITPPLMPAIMRPFLEQSSNWNFFMNRKIEDDGLRAMPPELRYKPWTSEAAKWFGSSFAGKLTGISPVMFEHHVRAMFGGLGAAYVLPAVDFAMRKTGVASDIPKADQPVYHSIPFIRALFSKEPSGFRAKTASDFFESHGKSLMADQGWKAMVERGQSADAYKMLADNPEAIYAKSVRKTLAEIGKVRKERDKLITSTMSGDLKRAAMDKLDDKVEVLTGVQQAMMHPTVMRKALEPMLPGFKKLKGDKKGIQEYYEELNAPVSRALPRVMAEWDSLSHMTQSQKNDRILSIIRKEQRGEHNGEE